MNLDSTVNEKHYHVNTCLNWGVLDFFVCENCFETIILLGTVGASSF